MKSSHRQEGKKQEPPPPNFHDRAIRRLTRGGGQYQQRSEDGAKHVRENPERARGKGEVFALAEQRRKSKKGKRWGFFFLFASWRGGGITLKGVFDFLLYLSARYPNPQGDHNPRGKKTTSGSITLAGGTKKTPIFSHFLFFFP